MIITFDNVVGSHISEYWFSGTKGLYEIEVCEHHDINADQYMKYLVVLVLAWGFTFNCLMLNDINKVIHSHLPVEILTGMVWGILYLGPILAFCNDWYNDLG